MNPSYTILHITDGFLSFKEKSSFSIGVGGKLTSGLIKAGHQVIEFPYRQIDTGFLRSYKTPWGDKALKRKLQAVAANLYPELIIFGQAYCFSNDFIEELKVALPKTKFLSWHQDSIFENNGLERFISRASMMDASFINTAISELTKYHKVHKNLLQKIHYLPIPVDSSVERGKNFLEGNLAFDVFSSAGNASDKRLICNKNEDLNHFIGSIKAELPKGTNYAFAGIDGKEAVYGKKYRDMLENSAIGLNFSRPGNILLYSSDRIAQIIGNGMLLAIESSSGFAQLLGGEKATLNFSSKEELIEKLNFFIKHPDARKKAAMAGYTAYYKWFNSIAVANYMLATVSLSNNQDSLVWLEKIKELQK